MDSVAWNKQNLSQNSVVEKTGKEIIRFGRFGNIK